MVMPRSTETGSLALLADTGLSGAQKAWVSNKASGVKLANTHKCQNHF